MQTSKNHTSTSDKARNLIQQNLSIIDEDTLAQTFDLVRGRDSGHLKSVMFDCLAEYIMVMSLTEDRRAMVLYNYRNVCELIDFTFFIFRNPVEDAERYKKALLLFSQLS